MGHDASIKSNPFAVQRCSSISDRIRGNRTACRGTVKRFAIKSTVLGEERIVLVRTPAGYETNKLSYPVLYMTDGDASYGPHREHD